MTALAAPQKIFWELEFPQKTKNQNTNSQVVYFYPIQNTDVKLD